VQLVNSILSHTPGELRAAFTAEGLRAFRADQVVRWVYLRGVRDFEEMSDLGRELRRTLGQRWRTRALERSGLHESADGTQKLILRCSDGAVIESVVIPEGDRRTLCVSSQVGCSLDCSFCATARLGFVRNLSSDEIVDQVLQGLELLRVRGESLTHVVFMGMGEPLLNLANVSQAIRILIDPATIALSRRRITVSTAGVVPRIEELGRTLRVRLAVSLHAASDEVRDRLVPLTRRFPISELLEACRRYPLPRRDRLSFEYALIDGVNDSPEDATRLAELLRGIPCKVNVIPLNEHPAAPYRRPGDDRVDAFVETLAARRVTVTVRQSRGDDIYAACGQLGTLWPGGKATVSAAAIR